MPFRQPLFLAPSLVDHWHFMAPDPEILSSRWWVFFYFVAMNGVSHSLYLKIRCVIKNK